MAEQEGRYNIKAVSSMLGIQPGTLRAWERRYKVIAPIRNEAGHRLYSEQHINILKSILAKINQGFTVSQAISMAGQKPSHLPLEVDEPRQDVQILQLTNILFEAFLQFDESKAQGIINTFFSLVTVEKVMLDIFQPILLKLGEYWQSGKMVKAHINFSTTIIKNRLISLHNIYGVNPLLPKVVAVCAPGDRHDIGLLMFSIILRQRGFEVVYLGTDLLEEDIYKALELLEADYLFISSTMSEHRKRTLELVADLKADYQDLKVGVGGLAISDLPVEERKKYHESLLGRTVNEWEKWILDRTLNNRKAPTLKHNID